MDIDYEIFYLGIIVGWIISILSVATVGLIAEIQGIALVIMVLVSGGVLGSMFGIAEIIYFFNRYKIVRRGKELKVCGDTHCGSYSKCDKIHCFQFYNKNGTVRRD